LRLLCSPGITNSDEWIWFSFYNVASETIDFMTVRSARLPYDFIDTVSNRIMNEISKVSLVVYDISSKPPATIEWE